MARNIFVVMHSPPLSDRHTNSPSSSVARRFGTKPQLCTPIISAVLTLCQSLNWAASSATLYNSVCIHPLPAPPLSPFPFLPQRPRPAFSFSVHQFRFPSTCRASPEHSFCGPISSTSFNWTIHYSIAAYKYDYQLNPSHPPSWPCDRNQRLVQTLHIRLLLIRIW